MNTSFPEQCTMREKFFITSHTELGDRHFSEISGKVEHRQISFGVQYDKNEPLESKVLRQKI